LLNVHGRILDFVSACLSNKSNHADNGQSRRIMVKVGEKM